MHMWEIKNELITIAATHSGLVIISRLQVEFLLTDADVKMSSTLKITIFQNKKMDLTQTEF